MATAAAAAAAASSSSSPSEPRAIEQVITEFFAKSLHIILESRSPYVSSRNYTIDHFNPNSPSSSSSSSQSPSPCSPSSSKPRDRWFNLALRECPAALENFDLWRQSNLEPLVIDIVLIRRASSPETPDRRVNWSGEGARIVERWVVQYESHGLIGRRRSRLEIRNLCEEMCKRSIVLLRSLYLFIRLLPAYKLFCELNSSGRIRPLGLSHRISSFVEPFTRAEDAEMKHFGFVPIGTSCGRLSLTVSYLPNLENVGSEPSTPLSPQFIMDYVGNPNTDPLKRFQILPSAMRRHSWSDNHGNLPSPSPSPTYSDSRALQSNQKRRLPPRGRDSSMSPQFSMWSSPSTPAQLSGGSLPTALMRCESAPVSIPANRIGALPPSPSLKSTNLGAEKKVQIKEELLKLGEPHTGMTLQKVLSFGRDDIGYLSGLKIPSCTSPRIPSRSSSRLSLFDEFDDSEIVYPFAEDDEDLTGACNRVEVPDVKLQEGESAESGGSLVVRRSPDALVGALVNMLKTAPPLRQDLSESLNPSVLVCEEAHTQRAQNTSIETEVGTNKFENPNPHSSSGIASSSSSSSSIYKSRTAADALEELRVYKELKELLLKQGEER
ncbi:Autophagy-related protein 13 [Ananas comosus]|uniref:Autophagy-related protein 13 n=1 Tax=Ananas comosus TaxID=4615 RepID=A0A199VYQ8_ANACO|nr:Autophagy-related protein 13 [Ananas comosus]